MEVSWPLAACLAAGQTEPDLPRLAERAERGEMGSLEDWICAEAALAAVRVLPTEPGLPLGCPLAL